MSDMAFRITAGASVDPGGSVLAGGEVGNRGVHTHGSVVAAGATFSFVWPPGGTYVFPTAGTALRVKAGGNAADDVAGTGARLVHVGGLNFQGEEISEVLTTAGIAAGPVNPQPLLFWRINQAHIEEVGSDGHNVGNVVIENSTGGTDLAHIIAEYGNTEQMIFTVPQGYTAFVTRVFVTTDSNEADVDLFYREHATPGDRTKSALVLPRAVGIIRRLDRQIDFPHPLPQFTDVWARARKTLANDAFVTVDCDILLVLSGG